MGYKVMIRLRGLTDWIEYGYVLTPKRADILVKELKNKVQIIALPTHKSLKEIEDMLDDESRPMLYDLSGDLVEDYRVVFETGFSGEDK